MGWAESFVQDPFLEGLAGLGARLGWNIVGESQPVLSPPWDVGLSLVLLWHES